MGRHGSGTFFAAVPLPAPHPSARHQRRGRRGACVGSTSSGVTLIGQWRSMASRSTSGASWVSSRGSVTSRARRRAAKAAKDAAAAAVR
ncbi:hypothetical protein C2845_PM14G15070 [Panicum miliaceum]|uniref:Uncharacterized protein n=1 Tax=Panicum miliaceum TaxID=4540 RepID=A0A3L6PS84_PANMI|nr:hypothetical protein C2845_PM14G15070 [Panicum miliaceum]